MPPKNSVQLRLSLKEEDVDLLEELFVQEGIIFDPDTVVLDIGSACHDIATALLVEAVEELTETVQEVYTCILLLLLLSSSLQGGKPCVSMVQLTDENEKLRHQLEVAQEIAARAQRVAADRSGGFLFGLYRRPSSVASGSCQTDGRAAGVMYTLRTFLTSKILATPSSKKILARLVRRGPLRMIMSVEVDSILSPPSKFRMLDMLK